MKICFVIVQWGLLPCCCVLSFQFACAVGYFIKCLFGISIYDNRWLKKLYLKYFYQILWNSVLNINYKIFSQMYFNYKVLAALTHVALQ